MPGVDLGGDTVYVTGTLILQGANLLLKRKQPL